jgi:hypothetical protein
LRLGTMTRLNRRGMKGSGSTNWKAMLGGGDEQCSVGGGEAPTTNYCNNYRLEGAWLEGLGLGWGRDWPGIPKCRFKALGDASSAAGDSEVGSGGLGRCHGTEDEGAGAGAIERKWAAWERLKDAGPTSHWLIRLKPKRDFV